jgi:hypothetical protein
MSLWFLRRFVPQKPRFMGCFGGLQGKKPPERRFVEVLCAKRDKLLDRGNHEKGIQ